MTGIGTGGVALLPEGEPDAVALEDVFVSIDLCADMAYLAYEDGSSIHWGEVSRADGELLVSAGVRAQVQLPSASFAIPFRAMEPRVDELRMSSHLALALPRVRTRSRLTSGSHGPTVTQGTGPARLAAWKRTPPGEGEGCP